MPVDLRKLIRDVQDFPMTGVLFRDITPLLADAEALRESVDRMCAPWRDRGVDVVAAMEARGFMFAAPMAVQLGAGFVPVRKEGKLPWRTRSVEYTLEYRSDVLHVHEDAVRTGQRVLVVDDVIATGGTAEAVVRLLEELGGDVLGVQFLVELRDLGGRELLDGYDVRSVIAY
ncbi:MAG: adenine phosphoribosyltransferase [Candidatus Dormibacteraeota bacterium]|nr:adenine phosphoribosyltransferase [Candidatus Dormibacteraeota bacterium]MBO0760649.1 adenine phosphoribosyltransferase [Candidatus Dormibacteraeota bacterium]